MEKAVGWIRRTGNAEEEAEQKAVIEEYCRKNMLNLVEFMDVPGEDFREVAYGTGWTRNRIIRAVVVASVKDVSEDYNEFQAYRLKLKLRNSDLMAADDGKYAMYKMYRNILEGVFESFCKMEVENDPIRVNVKRRRKMATGGYIGGNAPMGYAVENGKLVVNPEEVPVVLKIMERKHAGKSMLSTVDALNSEGYKTRKGKPFVISTVQSIWNNEPFYHGMVRYERDGEWVPGQHEAILK